MSHTHPEILDMLAQKGLELPKLAIPAAAYVPYTVTGNKVYISGQLPVKDGKMLVTGRLGAGVSIEDAQKAAQQCALNIFACLADACEGDLGRVRQILRLEVLVAATPEFHEPHVVANGASQLFLDAFRDSGKHARAAFGVAVLPLNACVEVMATAVIG